MIFRTPAIRTAISNSLVVLVVTLSCTSLHGQQMESIPSNVQLLMQRARQAAEEGNAEEAAGSYREVLRIKPRWAPAEFDLALAYHFQKHYAEAIDLFTDVLRQNPRIINAYLFRGLDYYETNHFEKAIASLKRVLELKPSDLQARFYLGASYYQLEDYRHAALAYAEQIRLAPKSEDAYFQLIQCYEALRDAALKQINADPQAGYFVLLLEAADDAGQQGRLTEKDIELAARSHPESPEAWLLLAERALRRGISADAKFYFAQAEEASLQLGPQFRGVVNAVRDPDNRCNNLGDVVLALCRAKQNDLPAATRILLGSAVPVRNARGLYWTVQTYATLIESASAKLAALSPDSPLLRRLHARAYARKGQRAEAAEEYEKAIAADDQDASALVEYANFRSIAQEFPQAIVLLQKALVLTPGDDKLVLLLGRTYALNNDPANAALYLDQSLKANPGDEQLRLELAGVLHTLGRVPEAIAVLEEAACDPDGRISYMLASYYALQGDKEKAKAAMNIFRAHRPSSGSAK